MCNRLRFGDMGGALIQVPPPAPEIASLVLQLHRARSLQHHDRVFLAMREGVCSSLALCTRILVRHLVRVKRGTSSDKGLRA
jgi:hypothetical protein